MKEKSLFEQLQNLSQSDMYPCHMPGHKRHGFGALPETFACMDITEISGFDNLHNAQGILKDRQAYVASVFHAEEAHFLVNGSTAGVLSAISAAVPFGGTLLLQRGAHKSAYHAAYLRRLELCYLTPSLVEGYDFCDAISPKEVEEAVQLHPEAKAVLIVSPTYEGRIADVEAIANIVHKAGKILIVDEAHGAHLGFCKGYAQNSSQCCADLVITSVHKTLPAPTQAALLFVNGDRVDRENLSRFLQIYQTSSPSYPMMAAIENAAQIMEEQGAELLETLRFRFENMQKHLSSQCKHIKTIPADGITQDFGKLVICADALTGLDIADYLRKSAHIEVEMASLRYCLAMFTVGDTMEGFDRMEEALISLDAQAEVSASEICEDGTVSVAKLFSKNHLPEQAMTIGEAWDEKTVRLPLENAEGFICGSYVNLYPPGAPLLVPGEVIDAERICAIKTFLQNGFEVLGIWNDSDTSITVISPPDYNKTRGIVL